MRGDLPDMCQWKQPFSSERKPVPSCHSLLPRLGRLLRARGLPAAWYPRRAWGRAPGSGAALAVLALGASAFAVPLGPPGTGSWRTVPGPAVPAAGSAGSVILSQLTFRPVVQVDW
jgi:hypothetical protein